MNLISKSTGAWGTLGRFGGDINYGIIFKQVPQNILTTSENLDGITGSILIDSGAGIGEVYTIVSAIWDSDDEITLITVSENLGSVNVGDTFCQTQVPTSSDAVVVTHAITAGATISVDTLDVQANLSIDSASTITTSVTIDSTHTFTVGTKIVGMVGTAGAVTFAIDSGGCVSGATAGWTCASITYGAVSPSSGYVFDDCDGGGITVTGNVVVGNITGSLSNSVAIDIGGSLQVGNVDTEGFVGDLTVASTVVMGSVGGTVFSTGTLDLGSTVEVGNITGYAFLDTTGTITGGVTLSGVGDVFGGSSNTLNLLSNLTTGNVDGELFEDGAPTIDGDVQIGSCTSIDADISNTTRTILGNLTVTGAVSQDAFGTSSGGGTLSVGGDINIQGDITGSFVNIMTVNCDSNITIKNCGTVINASGGIITAVDFTITENINNFAVDNMGELTLSGNLLTKNINDILLMSLSISGNATFGDIETLGPISVVGNLRASNINSIEGGYNIDAGHLIVTGNVGSVGSPLGLGTIGSIRVGGLLTADFTLLTCANVYLIYGASVQGTSEVGGLIKPAPELTSEKVSYF